MAQEHAEFEIVLRWRRSDGAFDVGLAYDDPSDPQDRRDYVDEPLMIDTAELLDLVTDPDEYGRRLGAMVLSAPKVRSFYDKALVTAEDKDTPLHLRLLIDPRAPLRYHQIRWEAIRDPVSGSRIATRHNVLLSRYLSTPDWRPVPLPPWHRLKALVVIANPVDLAEKTRVGTDLPLEPVDVPGELERARTALADMDLCELAEPGQATVKRIVAALSEGVDLLYLVCHGGMYGDQSRLYLSDDNGRANVVDGNVLAERIAELDRPPTIAVLCSCQSAGPGDTAMASDDLALTSLGPRLSGAGVAAVVAMQGSITMKTACLFFPAFFAELRRHGIVDRAMAVARSGVSDRERDWWMPVLFTRLKLGRAWYRPEFGDKGDMNFRALANSIKGRACTPILGSGVAGEGVLPSREQLAANLVDQWMMPIAPQNRGDLAKVAQYLSVRIAPAQTQTEVGLFLASELRDKHGSDLPAEVRQSEDVTELIRAVGRQQRQRRADRDPYTILAGLRLPIYVTTAWNGLLEDAIRDAGRDPTVRHFDWHRERYTEDDLPAPTPDKPLVYHLFGTLEEPTSLVVTEDHYFAWLTAWIKRVDKDASIPSCVASALTDSSLLFLGYRLDDWEFRVLFQSIKSFNGSVRFRENRHFGVQVSPESSMIEPEAAQEYLGEYFDNEKLYIYWGTCERFLTDLASVRQRMGHD